MKVQEMLIVNTPEIPGKTITSALGVVRGSSTRARDMFNDFSASIKNLIGGEVSEYTVLLSKTRETAIERMVEDAQRLGADAIVNVRFTTSSISRGVSEILAYGTAVKIQ